MSRREHRHQLSYEDFFLPFGGKLSAVAARKDDAAAADQAATAKVAVSVSAGCDGGLIQITPG